MIASKKQRTGIPGPVCRQVKMDKVFLPEFVTWRWYGLWEVKVVLLPSSQDQLERLE
jgi:hypothetical protein